MNCLKQTIHNYFFFIPQSHLKKVISTAINNDEKTKDHIMFKRLDGSTKPKIINSDIVVDLNSKNGMKMVKA